MKIDRTSSGKLFAWIGIGTIAVALYVGVNLAVALAWVGAWLLLVGVAVVQTEENNEAD